MLHIHDLVNYGRAVERQLDAGLCPWPYVAMGRNQSCEANLVASGVTYCLDYLEWTH